MVKENRTKPVTLAEPVTDFIKRFEKLRYNHNAFSVFSDFLALSALDISNAVYPNEDRKGEYQRVISKYNAEEQTLLAEMLGCIVQEMEPAAGITPNYHDVLGELFHSLNLQDEWIGQFFTPQDISTMMGLITAGDFEEKIAKRGYIKMLEPCIGGGSTVIGAVNAMFQKGYNPCKQLFVTGYDLDPRCIHMSYIQLSLMGIPAMIQQRNSLTLETYSDYWYTPVFVLDGWADRLNFERLIAIMRGFFTGSETPKEKAVAEIEAPAAVKPVKKTEQLTLF